MNIIFETKFGSHLYGTDTPLSDVDIKGVFLPTAREIILGKVPRNVSSGPSKAEGVKNQPGDVDREYVSLGEFCKLLAQGQTMALDMLFAPNNLGYNRVWSSLVFAKRAFLSKGILSFIGYARTQGAKYGIKGSRIAAVRKALEFLSEYESYSRLDELRTFPTDEFFQFVNIEGPQGKMIRHWEVVGRKFQLTATVKYVEKALQAILAEYGQRALQAEKNEGIDWKALSHAVRVNFEGIELLSTGHITFPRLERQLLLDIKLGKLPYAEVATIIETGLEQLQQAQGKSKLPDKPDQRFIDDWLYQRYSDVFLDEDTSYE